MDKRELWLGGKGPSLDKYDWSKAGSFRVGINETAFIIPDCYGAIANDLPILKKFKELPDNVVIYKRDGEKRIEFKNEILWKRPPSMFSTAIAAVLIFYGFGVRIIHFVGFDSVDDSMSKYAGSIKKIKGEGSNTDGYVAINKRLLSVIDELDIVTFWEHRL